MKQPEALRLAEVFDSLLTPDHALESKAAAELRRLHEVNQRLVNVMNSVAKELDMDGDELGCAVELRVAAKAAGAA